MAESAAQFLQQKHSELEGAPDPFPPMSQNGTGTGPSAGAARRRQRNEPLDTESESAFPSLASSAPPKAAAPVSAWATAPRIQQSAARVTSLISDSFVIENIDLSTAGKDGKPTTLAEIMKRIQAQLKNVKLEASTQRKDGRSKTSFVIKAENGNDLESAKRKLTAALSPIVTKVIQAPVSAIGTIVGVKGANLIQLRAKYDVRVDIPRKDASLAAPAAASGAASPLPGSDDEEEPTQPVTVVGPASSVNDAIAELNAIIATKTSRITQRVREIPAHIYPFIVGRQAEYEALAEAEGAFVTLSFSNSAHELSVTGDRPGVLKVVETAKTDVTRLEDELQSASMNFNKPQHRLLVGKFAEELMETAKCAVTLPTEPDSKEVTIWGMADDLPQGLQAVMKQAMSKHTESISVPAPSAAIHDYLLRTNYFAKTMAPAHPGVQAHITPRGKGHAVDFIGDKPAVAAAAKDLKKVFGDLDGSVREVEIDWLVHKFLVGKSGKKIKQFQDVHHTQVFFPAESEEKSSALLVYDLAQGASKAEKKKHLDEVERDLRKLAAECADVRSQEITVDKKWHSAIIGKGGSTLNAIIGEDKVLSIKVGSLAKTSGDHTLSEDAILVRGPSSDVTRAIEAIRQLVEKAKNDEIDSGFTTEFDISREYVKHIVGAGGSGVNKIRDDLDVKLDFTDNDEKEVKKGKKVSTGRSHVKITGRKENVEEAKKRILAQVDRLADETTEIIKIPHSYHSGLIGSAGKYVNRLEEKYGVKINFGDGDESRSGRNREAASLKPDEVMIKGGKKGVSQAKSELVEAFEYEKENNQTVEFTVPSRAVARILGKGGVQITEIKDETGTQIDVEKSDSTETLIKIRGTKSAIADAKKRILAIASEVGEETTVVVFVENRFHRGLIGAGGQGLKDLVAKVGGPSDPKAQAGLIHFPRYGEPEDEVRLRGDPALVKKLQAELEKIVANLRDRIVLGVDIPAQNHRMLIGRGGQNLTQLQDRHKVTVQFPGSRSYAQIGEPENYEELADVAPENLVKVSGSRAACEAAIKEMADRPPPQEQISTTINVPLRYVHSISQQGTFFRTLRHHGVQVEQSQTPSQPASTPRRPAPEGSAGRIDEEPTEPEAVQWEVVENHQDGEEGEAEWTLRGRDQAALDKAREMIEEAISQAQNASFVGFLTLADRSAFPRIVGSKGANVARLRGETGAEITVGREDNTIVIIGSQDVIENAKSKILDIVNNASRPRGNRNRDRDEE
ncbi:Vigilin 1 [Ceratobasidium sp. AG-Ba]|nr:Vigilin 1 [Ceratobasidium sp. AG-Ba]QRW08433.1 Vigilin 1 [Ceratobasidium sp. AG-Ba]